MYQKSVLKVQTLTEVTFQVTYKLHYFMTQRIKMS